MSSIVSAKQAIAKQQSVTAVAIDDGKIATTLAALGKDGSERDSLKTS